MIPEINIKDCLKHQSLLMPGWYVIAHKYNKEKKYMLFINNDGNKYINYGSGMHYSFQNGHGEAEECSKYMELFDIICKLNLD